ncbi:TonB-dependent receptor [Dyella sp. 20L07]|uniref:TonB-dependent receptor n=1 Tax=Dyella sp. 20L07 TaxID=3384240 RepID=UPI003D2C856F
MTDVAGLTSDGYIYTAEYFGAARDSILWAAYFRRNGKERGVRHGRLFGISKLSETDLRTAVKDDIEDTWVSGY